MIEITDAEFDGATGKGNVLVDFWAAWCGPCRMVAPILEQLSQAYDGKVLFLKMNVDENQSTPQAMNVRGIPTILLMKDGVVVDTLTGAAPMEYYVEHLATAFGV